MDSARFDRLATTLFGIASRRRVLQRTGTLTVSLALTGLHRAPATHAKKKKATTLCYVDQTVQARGKKAKKKYLRQGATRGPCSSPPPCIPACTGNTCGNDGCGDSCPCGADAVCQAGTCFPSSICLPGAAMCAPVTPCNAVGQPVCHCSTSTEGDPVCVDSFGFCDALEACETSADCTGGGACVDVSGCCDPQLPPGSRTCRPPCGAPQ